MQEASVRNQWNQCDAKMYGLPLRDLLFMDDGILWDSDTRTVKEPWPEIWV